MSVIDAKADTLAATVAVGSTPGALCYNPRGNKMYCAVSEANSVVVVDGAADTVIAWVPVGVGPGALCYDSFANKVYCANTTAGTVTVIDGAADSVLVTIGVGDEPVALCRSPAQNRVYVANSGSNTVSVIRDSMAGAVKEAINDERGALNTGPTIVRGFLKIRDGSGASSSPSWLMDIRGRRVRVLRSGENDVRHLAPGVYFVLPASSVERDASGTRRVVIAR